MPSRSRSRSPSPRKEESAKKSRSRSRSRSRSKGDSGGAGKIKGVSGRWNSKGFCFFKIDGEDEEVFCHFSAIQDGNMVEEGATVEFEKIYDDRKGKYRAENVTGGTTGDSRGGSDFGGGGRGGGGGGECYAFRDGNCQRGDSCRFSHGGGGGGGGRGGGDRYGGDRYGGDRGGGGRGGGGGECYAFRDGNCQRGDSCRFSHGGGGGGGGRGGDRGRDRY